MSVKRIEFPQAPGGQAVGQRFLIAVGLPQPSTAGFGYTWGYLAGFTFDNTSVSSTTWVRV